jgi:hypothetical protein
MILLGGVQFREIHSTRVSEDGEWIILYIEMTDGSTRAVHWRVEQVVDYSGEISPPDHAPQGVAVQ